MSEVKQVLCVRTDLNMRKGKIAAQCCHASMAVILERLVPLNLPIAEDITTRVIQYRKESPFHSWLHGSFTKICLQVGSEEELVEVYAKALSAKIPASMIIDSGKTEFHGVATKTVVAIGPWLADEIDNITGNLKLL